MLLAIKAKILLAVAAPLAFSAFAWSPAPEAPAGISAPALIELQPRTFQHRNAGDFSQDGRPVNAPLRAIKPERPLAIMTHQVTAADYQRCADDNACPRAGDPVARADLPVVNVSARDAEAYAVWLSARLGVTYRLPTDEEWAFAAGRRFRDDSIRIENTSDPAQRWLARYEQEAGREEAIEKTLRPLGGFGTNENGLSDIAGNVWEWTSSCFVRQALDPDEVAFGMPVVNCGGRVVEGRHRTYVTDFIRNARAGGCAVGTPPANLGFRLVRDQRGWEWLRIARALLGLGRA
jgi:formylglycine-generating enzyme required for sulfatase activity